MVCLCGSVINNFFFFDYSAEHVILKSKLWTFWMLGTLYTLILNENENSGFRHLWVCLFNVHNKVFINVRQKGNFYPKIMAPLKKIMVLNFNVWQMVDSESLLHNKMFVLKTFFFATIAIFCTQIKNSFWLTQAPNTSKHISRNKWATMKASRKNSSWQRFFCVFF